MHLHRNLRLFRDVPWRWHDVLLCFAPSIISKVVTPLLPLTVAFWLQWLWLPSSLVGQGWYLGYTLWAARNRQGALPRLPSIRTVLAELRWVLALLPAVFAAMLAVYIAAILVLGSGNSAPPNEGMAPIARSASRPELVGLAIIAVGVAPIAEELAFRGLIYNKLRQALPTSVALVLQAAAFGMVHYSLGMESAWGIGAGAIVIGLLYEWRKTLVAPILLHAFVNVVGMAIVMAYVAADADSPRLGIYVRAGQQGCIVTGVSAGSTAYRAGLRAGDLVTDVDGTAVRNFRELSATVHQKHVGDQVTIDFIRRGKSQRVEAILTRPIASGTEKSLGGEPP